ncbi:MAG: cation:proton antiporter [Bacilli bacterium]|jgi:NhaP-type Na+/H+ or K+/H+ antiporter|nr:cation:proton antiporter [Bacilli bacterium]
MLGIGLIIIGGIISNFICDKVKLPRLIGLMIIGFIIGPSLLNLIDKEILNLDLDIKNIALIILLIRAGLSININDLKNIKKRIIIISFIPISIEITSVALLGMLLLKLNLIEGLMLGSIVGAVSPAVIVDRGLKLLNRKYGTNYQIPQLMLIGGSLDSIFSVIIFNLILVIYQETTINYAYIILNVPLTLLTSIIIGYFLGIIINKLIKKINFDNIYLMFFNIALACLIYGLNKEFSFIPFSSLICVICYNMYFKFHDDHLALKLNQSFSSIWKIAEIFLFVLVGAVINISYLPKYLLVGLIIVIIGLLFRSLIIYLTLHKDLPKKETIFCIYAFLPKATVQAAIGGIPLSLGFSFGQEFLAISVIAIILTTLVGTILIDSTYYKLLTKEK